MSSVISVENLSKKYIIGHQRQERYTALRDVLANGAKRLGNKLLHPFAAPQDDPTHEEFWAHKGVSFDIQRANPVIAIIRILLHLKQQAKPHDGIPGRFALGVSREHSR